MHTKEVAGKSKSRGKKWVDFGPSLNSGSPPRLPEHQQGGLPGVGPVGPDEVGLGGALGGRRRAAMELPSVFD